MNGPNPSSRFVSFNLEMTQRVNAAGVMPGDGWCGVLLRMCGGSCGRLVWPGRVADAV